MGLPVEKIEFRALARSAVRRSTRGIVALLLDDATQATAQTTYGGDTDDIAAAWTEENAALIRLALESGAAKVLAVRVLKPEESADYAATLDTIKPMKWDWLAAPGAASADITAWIKSARAAGLQYKAVVANAEAPDCEGVVNFVSSGDITTTCLGSGAATMTAANYTVRIAGVLAGLSLDRSATGYVLEDITAAPVSGTYDADIDAGKLVLYFNGTSYEIARGVTSLTTTSESTPALFKKIKHVEGCDLIARDTVEIFRVNYRGIRPNTYANKQDLVAELIAYLGELTGTVLDDTFENTAVLDLEAITEYLKASGVDLGELTEDEILRHNTDESVFVRFNLKLVDAMEDFYVSAVLN